MLEHIDAGLESLLRASVPLSALDIDVSFEAPDREWAARLSRATVNCFLWDIRRSSQRSEAGMRVVERDGVKVHAPVLPVLELRYVITAWTSDHRDERALLSGLTRSVLAAGEIPREHLPDALAELDVPRVEMARSGEEHMDVFKALEGKIKPGINVVISTQYEIGVGVAAGPPVQSIVTQVGGMHDDDWGARTTSGVGPSRRAIQRRRIAGEVIDAHSRELVGATVRSSVDATRIDPTGRFLLVADTGDEIVIDAPGGGITEVVPEVGGIRFS